MQDFITGGCKTGAPIESGCRGEQCAPVFVFHNRVGTIGYRAFGDNSMLETVTGIENVEQMDGDPFMGTPFENKNAE